MKLVTVLLAAACAAGISSFAATNIESGVTIVITDATVADYAGGISFADATGVVEFDTSSAPTMDITGAGTVKKTSASDWTMSTLIANFKGDYDLSGGGTITVDQGKNTVFGDDSCGNLYVRAGTTLDFVNTGYWGWVFGDRVVHLAGSGANGAGAFRALHANAQMGNIFKTLVLEDDATIYLISNGSGAYFYLNRGEIKSADDEQKTLTIAGAGELRLYPSFVCASNVAVLATGSARIRNQEDTPTHTGTYAPSTTDPITFEGSSAYTLYAAQGTTYAYTERAVAAIDRPVTVKGSPTLLNLSNWGDTSDFADVVDRTRDDVDNIRGDLTIAAGATAQVRVQWTRQLRISGHLLGSGTLEIPSINENRGRTYISSTNDAFTGSVTLGNKGYHPRLLLGAPGSLPDYSKVTVGSGYVGLDLRHWDVASVRKFANEANYSGINASTAASVGLDTTFFGGREVPFCYPGADTVTPVGGCVPGTIRLTNVVTTAAAPLRVTQAGGTMRIVDEGRPIYLGAETKVANPTEFECSEPSVLTFENADLRLAASPFVGYKMQIARNIFYQYPRMVISNSTLVAQNLRSDYSDIGTDAFVMGGLAIGGSQYGGGVLEILDDSVVTTKLVVAGRAWYGRGSVCQRGGSVTVLGNPNSWDYSSSIGGQNDSNFTSGNTHGFYELSGGTFKALGRFSIGFGFGGTWFQSGGYATLGKALGSDVGARLQIADVNDNGSVGGTLGEMYVTGGTFDVGEEISGDITYLGCGGAYVQLTADGPNALLDFRSQHLAGSRSSTSRARINVVNGGTVRAIGFDTNCSTSEYGFNFNGGTLKLPPYEWQTDDVFHRESAQPTKWFGLSYVLVHAGGATIDTDGNDRYTDEPIQGVSGKGVTSIELHAALEKVSFPPQVVIEGDGCGAAAVCVYDSKKGSISGIRILAPGTGYTTATAYLQWGGHMNVTWEDAQKVKQSWLTCTLGDVSNTGSFTKAGAGTFSLGATNTWGGATIVKGGALRAKCDWAIPKGTDLVLAGGDVNFGGKTGEVASVTYLAGGGALLNASSVVRPAAAVCEISTADLAAGKTIALSGDHDLSQMTVRITGDVSALAANGRYDVVTTTGAFTGTPAIELDPSIVPPWRTRVQAARIRLVQPTGFAEVLK